MKNIRKITPLILSCAFAFFGYSATVSVVNAQNAQNADKPARAERDKNDARADAKKKKGEDDKELTKEEREKKRIAEIKKSYDEILRRLESDFASVSAAKRLDGLEMTLLQKDLGELVADPLFEKATNVKKEWASKVVSRLGKLADDAATRTYIEMRSDIIEDASKQLQELDKVYAEKLKTFCKMIKDPEDNPKAYYVKVPREVLRKQQQKS